MTSLKNSRFLLWFIFVTRWNFQLLCIGPCVQLFWLQISISNKKNWIITISFLTYGTVNKSQVFRKTCSEYFKAYGWQKWKTYNNLHKFWDQSTSPPLSMLLASIWDSFLAQALVLLLCQYTVTLSRREGLNLFLQSGSFQNFQNRVGLNNLCEILSQKLRKLNKWNYDILNKIKYFVDQKLILSWR